MEIIAADSRTRRKSGALDSRMDEVTFIIAFCTLGEERASHCLGLFVNFFARRNIGLFLFDRIVLHFTRQQSSEEGRPRRGVLVRALQSRAILLLGALRMLIVAVDPETFRGSEERAYHLAIGMVVGSEVVLILLRASREPRAFISSLSRQDMRLPVLLLIVRRGVDQIVYRSF
ncbi:hypothetical protein PMAYCL1PPCAC_21960 [Pristionchus mayeri]|uniref:Uncharacterized protein n=1 Tax=Pristionchus mayeri TaxID=1317129 RepID=A0AAN5I555_9BILA|nr:hypothetical protein PMAYCL1PPCAC_21960 [Pristionchus mayeri]